MYFSFTELGSPNFCYLLYLTESIRINSAALCLAEVSNILPVIAWRKTTYFYEHVRRNIKIYQQLFVFLFSLLASLLTKKNYIFFNNFNRYLYKYLLYIQVFLLELTTYSNGTYTYSKYLHTYTWNSHILANITSRTS